MFCIIFWFSQRRFLFSLTRNILISFLLLVAFTKRAQFPFSAWLPAAISAPTPVRALVHRSTLVCAGVIILLKVDIFLKRSLYLIVVSLIGLLTIFIAGAAALVEYDFKKLIALRTLRQIGLLIFGIRTICKTFVFFHMFSHGFFKALLFILVGFILHIIFGQQDFRNYFIINQIPFNFYSILFCCLVCLCGLLFTSGFFRKDTIFEI